MPPWIERDQPTPFDDSPIEGRRDLDGDELASKYDLEWIAGKKYPIIHFPSDVEREITSGRGEKPEPHVHIFGSFELPYQVTRDEAYARVIPIAKEQGLIIGREHQNALRIFNPQTRRSCALTFDNASGRISNLEIFPQYATELLPGELRAILPPLYSQEKNGLAAITPVKFFTPDADWTWYATEFDGEDLFFGMVSGFEVELGYFRLSELEEVRGQFDLPIERDQYFQPKTLKEAQDYEHHVKRK